MAIILRYNLSEPARRAELAAGRSGEASRTIECVPSAYLASVARLDGPNGAIERRRGGYLDTYDTIDWRDTYHGYGCFRPEADRVLTADSAEQWIRETDERCAAELTQERAAYLTRQAENERERTERAKREAVERAEREKRETVERAERAKRLEPFEAWARRYVIAKVPGYARAASEEFDVTRQAKAAQLEALQAVALEIASVVESYRDEPRTDAPAAEAWRVFDATETLTIDPAAGSVVASIVRADLQPSGGTFWRTCVKVTVKWADGDSDELFLLADAAGGYEEDDGESE